MSLVDNRIPMRIDSGAETAEETARVEAIDLKALSAFSGPARRRHWLISDFTALMKQTHGSKSMEMKHDDGARQTISENESGN